MNAPFDPGPTPELDVAIVGAGISGIGMAAHLQRTCPGMRFAVLERREAVGGTWDLFRYPGVRSDSDMHTLGFAFAPWTDEKSIAEGPAILAYLNRVVDDLGLRRHIRFGRRVLAAEWDSAAARWSLTLATADGSCERLVARFLFLGSGYYDYDEPHDPVFEGRDEFRGTIVHPQFWPEDFDCAGKRVVVIGSGATAATIIPAMARQAAHVTMLQRTPSWYFSRPSVDSIANRLRKLLPQRWAYALTRFKNVRIQDITFRRARQQPEAVGRYLKRQVRSKLGQRYDPAAFSPPYGPWQQRLCLIPDDDLFEAINAGKASIVTDGIVRFDASGLRLASGRHLAADVIVTATGLRLALAGKIAVSLDGVPVRWSERFYYRNCMFSNLPNLAGVFGYLNASWTLRVDIVAEYVCRVLRHMAATGADTVIPVLPDGARLEEDNVFGLFSSGYLQRSRDMLPKSAKAPPWRLNQDYLFDRKDMRRAPLEDGILRFDKVRKIAPAPQSATATGIGAMQLSG